MTTRVIIIIIKHMLQQNDDESNLLVNKINETELDWYVDQDNPDQLQIPIVCTY